MREVVIVDALRAPTGRRGGALSSVHPVDLLAHVLESLVARTGVDPERVDDVIGGCVSQSAEQSGNVTRHGWLAAGLPESVPATTVDRQCGSSQQAVHFAAHGIAAGAYDVAIACGVESMTRVPMGSNTQGADPFGSRLRARYDDGLVHQGISAELIAGRWAITREDADAYALASHERAARATAEGAFADEIVPVEVGDGESAAMVRVDEGIRPNPSATALAGLAPAFHSPGEAAAYPEIPWIVTAGNASQISDGAAALLLADRETAARMALDTRWRIRETAVVGVDPVTMLTGPVPATHAVLGRAGLDLDDIDHFEINEAFASVVLAWQAEIGADPERVNPRGGAIALGHPLGASGARLMTTLLHALEQRGERLGLQSMCEGGGMANATIVERLG